MHDRDKIEAAIRDAGTSIALAKDRIFLKYLESRGLIQDYEEWVHILNQDEAEMQRLVLGNE